MELVFLVETSQFWISSMKGMTGKLNNRVVGWGRGAGRGDRDPGCCRRDRQAVAGRGRLTGEMVEGGDAAMMPATTSKGSRQPPRG